MPLCREFLNLDGVEFTFIATTPLPSERARGGYEDMNNQSFVLKAYENNENKKKAEKLIRDADIFLNGDKTRYTALRLKAGKPAYVVTERYFRDFGKKYRKTAAFRFSSWLYHVVPFKNKNVRYLASSAYLAEDINSYHHVDNPIFKWGYFIDPWDYTPKKSAVVQAPLNLLWVGRLLQWKHPDYAIDLVESLNQKGISCNLKIIGNGPEQASLLAKTKSLGIEGNIKFIDSVSHSKMKEFYSEADIFLFTSDYNEGWGAVLGEALSSGCICFASNQAGSTPYLIRSGFNGYTFDPSSSDALISSVLDFLSSKVDTNEIKNNAVATMREMWSPKNAAIRLLKLDEALNHGKNIPFSSGPCSKAEILSEDRK